MSTNPWAPHYRIHTALPLTELVPFVRQHLNVLTPWSVLYWLTNLAVVGWIVYRIATRHAAVDELVFGLGQGFWLFLFLLLPLHEGLHALAYKLAGAPSVGFGGDWRRLVFYAYADRFIVARRPFVWVAVTPFVVINSLLVAGVLLLPVAYSWAMLGALLLHTGGCFGDFGLINFFYQHRHEHLVTVDDVAARMVYMLEPADDALPATA